MNGWTVVLVAADVLGVAVAVMLLVRGRGGDPLLRIRIVGVAVTGALIAYVAWHVAYLGPVLTPLLLVASLVPAVVMRWAFIAMRAPGRPRRVRRAATFPVVIPAAAVIGAVVMWGMAPQLTADERDAARFGVKVDQHLRAPRVAVTFLDRRPDISDAGVDGGMAVPIEQYVLDGRTLTLLIWHHGLCLPAAVVLGPGPDALDAVVVATPFKVAPSGRVGATHDCRADPSQPFNLRTAIDIDLPANLRVTNVDDVGAGGAALAATGK
jgi:hypothetical protein